MAQLLTRKELERQIAPSFTPAQTTVLVDVLDNYNAFEIERVADTRALKAGQQALTDKVGVLTDKFGVLTDKVGVLTDKVGELADAQARTEARMEQGFAHMQGAITALTTQMSVLTTQVSNLGQQVGSMVNTFGFSLEDFTAALLPPYIEHHFGVAGLELARAHFSGAGGAPEEVDLAGQGVREGEAVAVFVEVKTSIGGTEARRLADKLDAVAGAGARSLKLIVAMNIHPSAAEAIAGRDITIVPYRHINRYRA